MRRRSTPWSRLAARLGGARSRRASAPVIAPIGEAPEGSLVLVTGAVVGGDAVLAPLSGRRCVLYEVTVTEEYDDGTVTVVRQRGGGTLAIDDGSGRALVELAGAELDVVPHRVTRVGRGDVLPPVEGAFLAVHAGRGGGPAAIPPFVCCERVVAIGDPVTVRGRAVREPDPDGAARTRGYRGDAPTRLRFTSSAWDTVRIADAPPGCGSVAR